MFTNLRSRTLKPIIWATLITLFITACAATTGSSAPNLEPTAPALNPDRQPIDNDSNDDPLTSGIFDSTLNPLLDTQWQLTNLTNADGNQPIIADITLDFVQGNSFNGHSGCNSYSATFTLENGKLSLNPIMQTMMACLDDDKMALETTYTAALATAHTVTLEEDTLTLTHETGQLVYTKIIPPPPATLVDTIWQLHTLTNDQAASSLYAGTFTNLIFHADGTMNSITTCNAFAGSYTVEDDQLTFGPMAGTLALCGDDDFDQQESQYVAALNSATSHTIDADTLTITHPDGTLQFKAQPTIDALVGTTWQLTSWRHQGLWRDVIANTDLTIAFTKDQINGQTGCNNYFGDYTATESTVIIDMLATTRRACADETISQQETNYLAALSQITHQVRFDNDSLTLFTPIDTLFFTPIPATP